MEPKTGRAEAADASAAARVKRRRQSQSRDEQPTDPRATAAFWRSRHSQVPLRAASEQEMTVRFLVPLPLQERVVAAGGRIVHASMRKLLGAENADATGFTIDLAVAEGRTRGGRLGGMQVVAASYRWEDVVQRQLLGGRTVTMPSNNNWFVQYLDAHQVLGWLDYLAHDFGDPALKDGVLRHMGRIYSTLTVVPDYLLDPTKTKVAMMRGWIYQESAFTILAGKELAAYAEKMRQVLRWFELPDHTPGCLPSWANSREDIATAVEGLAALYERRCGPLFAPNWAGFADTAENIRSSKPPCRCSAGRVLFPLENYLQEIGEAQWPRQFVVSQRPTGTDLSTANDVIRCFPSAVLDAFATLDFTQESDFVVGTLSQIAQQFFGEILEAQDVLAAAGLLDFMLEQQRALNVAGLDAQVSLAIDMASLADPAARAEFEQSFQRDTAILLGVDATRVAVSEIMGGSVIVLFKVLPAEDGTSFSTADLETAFAAGPVSLAGCAASDLTGVECRFLQVRSRLHQLWTELWREQVKAGKERATLLDMFPFEQLESLRRLKVRGWSDTAYRRSFAVELAVHACDLSAALRDRPSRPPAATEAKLRQTTSPTRPPPLPQTASSFYGKTPTDQGNKRMKLPAKAPSILETRKRRYYKAQGMLKDYLEGKKVPAVPGSAMWSD